MFYIYDPADLNADRIRNMRMYGTRPNRIKQNGQSRYVHPVKICQRAGAVTSFARSHPDYWIWCDTLRFPWFAGDSTCTGKTWLEQGREIEHKEYVKDQRISRQVAAEKAKRLKESQRDIISTPQ